jgi:hypothetical protein
MDMAFLLRAQRLLADRQSAKLDFAVLTAALAARRSIEPRCQNQKSKKVQVQEGEEALVEVVLGGPKWRQAASKQQGCFSRAEAGRRINGL